MAKIIHNTLCWLWLLFTVLKYIHGVTTCTKLCQCNQKKENAMCGSPKLRYIPKLPSFVKNAKFIGNNFSSPIDRNFFSNLTQYNNIQILHMANNSIINISPEAFLDFRDLTSLEISKEPNLNINALKKSFRSLNSSNLQYLSFSYNGWKTLPVDFFAEFGSVRNLSLSFIGNQLQNVTGKIFSTLSVTVLNVSDNVIKYVNMRGLHHLESLNLIDNYISDIPVWSRGNECFAPNLRKLCLNRNSITEIDQNSFRCLRKLEYLRLDSNNIRILKNNTFSALERLDTLHVSDNFRLEIIEDIAFNATSLKSLHFQNNGFHFNRRKHWNADTLFSNCPNLEILDMTNNFLQGRHFLVQMLKPLAKIKKLIIPNTRLRYMPFDLFPKLKRLKALNLQSNFIQGWNDSYKIFGYNTSLKNLNLGENNIRIVNITTFPRTLLASLTELDLSNNDFSCTCDQMWFRDWIRKNIESKDKSKLSLKGFPEKYKCEFPSELKDVLLQQYNPTPDSCEEKNLYVIMEVSLTSFVLSVVIVVIVLHRCQTNVRNYIYLCRLNRYKKSGYIRIDNDEDYEYHAFIVYCDEDRDWVHKICLKKLEDEGMKVCIHQRDFDIGEPVTANIEKYMSKCHKIIVVMSNDFTESEWCQWEVDLVLDRRRRQGKDVSILVMLKTIDSRHMTNSLKALLESTPHLKYCTGFGEKMFWMALLEGLRKPFGQPPVAVLN